MNGLLTTTITTLKGMVAHYFKGAEKTKKFQVVEGNGLKNYTSIINK